MKCVFTLAFGDPDLSSLHGAVCENVILVTDSTACSDSLLQLECLLIFTESKEI